MKKKDSDEYIYDDENGSYTWYNSFEEALKSLENSCDKSDLLDSKHDIVTV